MRAKHLDVSLCQTACDKFAEISLHLFDCGVNFNSVAMVSLSVSKIPAIMIAGTIVIVAVL